MSTDPISHFLSNFQPPVGDPDEVVKSGPDKGKTAAQLHAEIFNPAESDRDYFLRRCKELNITTETPL